MRRASVAAAVVGLASLTGISAYAIAAPAPTKHTLHETVTGAAIILSGTKGELVYKVTNPVDGTGAGIDDFTNNGTTTPLSGKGTLVAYFADGVQNLQETYKLGVPNASGIATLTGSGKCVSGTLARKTQKCTYTFAGTENLSSFPFAFTVKVTGTYTR